MSRNELEAKIEELKSIEELIAEAQEEAETIKDSIKAEMLERDVSELVAGKYIIRWTSVVSNKFDSASFKKVYNDLYKAFTKQVESRRFSIA